MEKQLSRVLMIDDQRMVIEIIETMLHGLEDIEFHFITDSTKAMTVALELQPTVILADLMMPEIDGFGILSQFRAQPGLERIPIILLSSEAHPELKVRAFESGAHDYLIKWPDKLELIARIRYHSSAYLAHKQRDDAFQSLRESQQELLCRTEQLADSQAALHHAQKMEAIGKLTGGVAHDFNNVLQIISGNLQLLRIEADGQEGLQNRIMAALAGVERGAKLAAQLLAFARRQPLQPVVTDVGSLLRSIDELLRRAIDDRMALKTVVASDLWNALVDPNQLENVVLNLAINARDAMAGAGSLVIEASNLSLDQVNEAEHDDLRPGEYLLITVTDNGSGMTPEVLQRVYEPFFTTKPEGEGTGLGLSMAYGFVKQSGGHISIESQPAEGTVVRIYLPRASGEVALRVQPEAAAVLGGVETILVVEDEEEVRETTVAILSRLGYRVLQARDARGGLQIIESGTHIDVLFTDVVMPGEMRSVDLVERAKKLCPRIRILYASGYTKGNLLEKGGLDPGVNLLQKPYSHEELARRIRHLLREASRRDAA